MRGAPKRRRRRRKRRIGGENRVRREVLEREFFGEKGVQESLGRGVKEGLRRGRKKES